MKKTLYFCLFVYLSLLPSTVLAESIDVGSFEEFNAAVVFSSPTVEISLTDNITINGELNVQNADELYINGNDYYIDGNNLGKSFKVGTGKTIVFSTVTISSFNALVDDSSADAAGGVIYSSGAVEILNTVFSTNSITSSNTTGNAYACGGGVYSSSFTNIKDSFFENNYASATVSLQTSTAIARGGALFNAPNAILNISSSSFTGNFVIALSSDTEATTEAYGGAIYNNGITNIYNSSFISNEAVSDKKIAHGGAIFNASSSTLNIIADGGNVEFKGNRAGYISNALFNADETSVINMNAAADNKIVINDAIDGNNGKININMTGEWDITNDPYMPGGNKLPITAPVDGIVEINNSITGNDIIIHNGTLRLGVFDREGNPDKRIPDSKGSIGTDLKRNDLTMSTSSVLDMVNGNADDIVYLRDFIINGDSKLNIEVDLANSLWDQINVSGTVSGLGKLDISSLTIITDFTSGVSLDAKIFTNPLSESYFVNIPLDIYRYRTDISSSIYNVTQAADFGTINILLVGYSSDTFKAAMSSSSVRVLQLESDYYTPSSYDPNIAPGTLTIRGKNVTIDGAGVNGIFVLQDENVELLLSNITIKSGYAPKGAAISNAGTTLLSGITFSSNVAKSTLTESYGGSVYNSGNLVGKNLLFLDNVAISTFTLAKGGAFYNATGSTASLYNVSFVNNLVMGSKAAGGAIYNEGILNIIADGGNVEFSNNNVDGASNAIHNAGGAVLNLNAGSGIIIINDSITSEGSNNIINMNPTLDIEIGELNSLSLSSAPIDGIIFINADMTKFGNLNSSSGNIVNIYNGNLKFGPNTLFFSDAEVNIFGPAALDFINNKIDNISVNNLNLPKGNVNISVDVDLRNAQADNFVGTQLSGSSTGTLTVKNIVLRSDVDNLEKQVNILIADDENLKNAILLDNSAKKIMGPIFLYDTTYCNGILGFKYASDYNPSIFIAPITMKIGGYLGQLNAYNQAFDIMPETVNGHYRKGLWIKPYGYDEEVELNMKLTVSNMAYGAFFGYDTEMSDIGRGFSGNFSIFGSFNASNLKYEGAKINQEGGLLGVTAAIYKENFFTALTTNVGIISEHGIGAHGKDDFMMYTKGIASKTGYNFVLDYNERLKLQPAFNISCSSIDMDSYLNGADVQITSDGMIPVNIEPSVSFAADLKDDFITFINLSMAWTVFDDSGFTANDITLPDLKIDPYMQYGIGFSKALGEKFSTRAELYGRSLGRAGIGGQINLRWTF